MGIPEQLYATERNVESKSTCRAYHLMPQRHPPRAQTRRNLSSVRYLEEQRTVIHITLCRLCNGCRACGAFGNQNHTRSSMSGWLLDGWWERVEQHPRDLLPFAAPAKETRWTWQRTRRAAGPSEAARAAQEGIRTSQVRLECIGSPGTWRFFSKHAVGVVSWALAGIGGRFYDDPCSTQVL